MDVHETVQAGNSFEEDSPTYRVNFWSDMGRGSWGLEAFILHSPSDVTEVLEWAEQNRQGRRYEIFVEVEGEEPTQYTVERSAPLIRLLGEDPTADDSPHRFV